MKNHLQKQTKAFTKAANILAQANLEGMHVFVCGIIDTANFIVAEYPQAECNLNDIIYLADVCYNTFADWDCDVFSWYCQSYIKQNGIDAFKTLLKDCYKDQKVVTSLTEIDVCYPDDECH